jgi:plastocyanin
MGGLVGCIYAPQGAFVTNDVYRKLQRKVHGTKFKRMRQYTLHVNTFGERLNRPNFEGDCFMFRVTLMSLVISTIAIMFSACAPQSNSSTDTRHSEHNADTALTSALADCPATIIIKNLNFNPAQCKVKVGITLSFKNEDGFPHTATALATSGVSFDTGELKANTSKNITFDTASTIDYRCEIHPDMTGIIVVEP